MPQSAADPAAAGEATPDVSVVVPIYDEQENLPELAARLRAVLEPLDLSYEVVFVNDGSRDASLECMRELRAADARIKIVDFSRNFGHQIAVSAGLDHARGRAVVVMDGDLQDPPDVLPRLIERWREGYDVVYAVRRQRKESLPLRIAYHVFYRLARRMAPIDLPLDAGDFSLMDRRVVDEIVRLPERNRFVRGLRAWVGFRQTGVEYERAERYAGKPKYTLSRLFVLAYDGIFSFSDVPVRVARDMGLVITAGAALLAAWTLFKRVVHHQVVPGFATITLLVLFFGGVQLVTVGVLGEYIARIYTEVKGRPLYVVRSLEGVEPPRHGAARASGARGAEGGAE
ncbi:MAG TPA: glycosyltransferase family 2 protein [Myxococcota bacterium]